MNEMGGLPNVRIRDVPQVQVESIEIEDQVLPDGNHIHKEKHFMNGVESV